MNVSVLRPRRNRSAYHRGLMESYYLAREVQEREAEAFSNGHTTELAEFYKINKRVLFKDWLRSYPASLGYYAEAA